MFRGAGAEAGWGVLVMGFGDRGLADRAVPRKMRAGAAVVFGSMFGFVGVVLSKRS